VSLRQKRVLGNFSSNKSIADDFYRQRHKTTSDTFAASIALAATSLEISIPFASGIPPVLTEM
jgi:hypothetical protein